MGGKMKIVAGTLMLLFLFLSLAGYAIPPFRNGIRPPTPEEMEYLEEKVIKIEVIEPNKLALERYRLLPGKRVNLASAVKNYEWLPVVGSQGHQGSCAAWSVCYYYKTYQESKEHAWGHPDPNSHPEQVSSPAFGYNLVNGGYDGGSWPLFIMQLMVDLGCATWEDIPYDDSDYVSWPDEGGWRRAIPYRADTVAEIDLSSDTGINLLKQHLANGDLATMAIPIYENFYHDYPDDAEGINNGVLFHNVGSYLGGHALTVIGYDDDRSYWDGTETKYGAFEVVNSWGSNWGWEDADLGTKGFCWFSYEYMKDESYQEAWIMTDKQSYTPTAYGIFGLNHQKRGELKVTFRGGEDPLNPEWDFNCLPNLGGSWYQDDEGIWHEAEHPVNQNIVVDLTSYTSHPDEEVWLKVDDLPAGNHTGSDTTGQITYLSAEYPKVVSRDVPKDTFNGGSIYVQLGSPENLEEVFVYPNPCYPERGQLVNFVNLPLGEGVKINIYTVSGELIRTLSQKSTWNCRNQNGEEVVRGIYIYLITDETGNKRLGKIAIVR